mmetsp:Transcript_25758/g.45728  ORF Transcript_25758/g.45728 Transcript_25758/m.45728 type:complete len:99 (-) Transcript_25758:566-862(-)
MRLYTQTPISPIMQYRTAGELQNSGLRNLEICPCAAGRRPPTVMRTTDIKCVDCITPLCTYPKAESPVETGSIHTADNWSKGVMTVDDSVSNALTVTQ